MSVKFNLSMLAPPSAGITPTSSVTAELKSMAPLSLTPLVAPKASTASPASTARSSAGASAVALPAERSPVTERRCAYFGELQVQLMHRLRQPVSVMAEPAGRRAVSASMRADCLVVLAAFNGNDVSDPVPGI